MNDKARFGMLALKSIKVLQSSVYVLMEEKLKNHFRIFGNQFHLTNAAFFCRIKIA